jgi:hypothetical protein
VNPRRLAFFSAAILAALTTILTAVMPAGSASAASVTAAGNRVWAISSAAQAHVRADRPVSPGQRLGEPGSCPFYAYGACVAPEAGGTTARAFASADPHVADAANAIEGAMPGRVVGVNQMVPMANGLSREADVNLGDLLVQVKSGNARGLVGQIQQTEASTGLPTVGYAPSMPAAAWASAAQQGVPVARNLDELIMIIRELG